MNQREIFWISLTVFLTIVSWMILDIYRAKTQVTVESELKSLQTVDFTLKADVLEILKNREY